jgi:flagellum-specific peptidoglycan hydrolase FlgJ
MRIVLISLLLLTWSYADSQTINKTKVYQEIVDLEIKFPDIALAQAVLESGNFSSKIAKKNNNLFGMRMPKIRKTTAIGQRYGYAKYNNWKDSIKDYKLWQDVILKKYPNMTRSQYKSYINRVYSTGKNYISKINLIIQKNKNKYEEDSTYASYGYSNDVMWINL